MVSIQIEGFGCLLCNFDTANENALKEHISQKHNLDEGKVFILTKCIVVSLTVPFVKAYFLGLFGASSLGTNVYDKF